MERTTAAALAPPPAVADPPPASTGPGPALPRAPIRARIAEFCLVAVGEAKPTKGAGGRRRRRPPRLCAAAGCSNELGKDAAKYCSRTCANAVRLPRRPAGQCVVCAKPCATKIALVCSGICRDELIRRRAAGQHRHTPEFTARVQRLWDDGLTNAAIAEQVGVTKGCIVGLVHRLGFPARSNPAKPKPTKVKRERPRSPPPSFRWKSDPTRRTPPHVPTQAVGKRIDAAARSAVAPIKVLGTPGTGCQFPISERPWRICDAPRVPNRAGSMRLGPYCAECSRRCLRQSCGVSGDA